MTAATTGHPPTPRSVSSRAQLAATLTGVPPQASLHPRAQLAAGGRDPAQDQFLVMGSVALITPDAISSILQNGGNGSGPANRVKAARGMIGVAYKQQINTELRTGATPEALKYMDCSEFVSRVLAIDGITNKVLSMNTDALKALLDQKDKFTHSKDTPRVGDIALWKGHVGIVSAVEKGSAIKLIHAAGVGKLSLENKYAIKPSQYRSGTFYGYYRPLHEERGGGSTAPVFTAPVRMPQPVLRKAPSG